MNDTLQRYANRAKNIKNKARINEDPKDAMLREYQNEIEELKKLLSDGRVKRHYKFLLIMSSLIYCRCRRRQQRRSEGQFYTEKK